MVQHCVRHYEIMWMFIKQKASAPNSYNAEPLCGTMEESYALGDMGRFFATPENWANHLSHQLDIDSCRVSRLHDASFSQNLN